MEPTTTSQDANQLYVAGYQDAHSTCLTGGPQDARTWLNEQPVAVADPYRAGWAAGLADYLDANGLPPMGSVRWASA